MAHQRGVAHSCLIFRPFAIILRLERSKSLLFGYRRCFGFLLVLCLGCSDLLPLGFGGRGLGLLLVLGLGSSDPLLLGFRGCCFGLLLVLCLGSSDPLLLGFCGRCFGLLLVLCLGSSDPLLLGFFSVVLRLRYSCRLCPTVLLRLDLLSRLRSRGSTPKSLWKRTQSSRPAAAVLPQRRPRPPSIATDAAS